MTASPFAVNLIDMFMLKTVVVQCQKQNFRGRGESEQPFFRDGGQCSPKGQASVLIALYRKKKSLVPHMCEVGEDCPSVVTLKMENNRSDQTW